jgi:anti-sigma regulatory factor (Ser/Thr protein kinase)
MGPSSAEPAGSTSVFAARLSELSQMVHLVRARCVQLGAAPELVVRIELALEELFANTVHHGYRSADGGQIWITIERNADGIRVIYEDSAPPYNPLAVSADAADALDRTHGSSDPETRPVGGLGRMLVARLSTGNSYAYDTVRHRNVIRLEFLP